MEILNYVSKQEYISSWANMSPKILFHLKSYQKNWKFPKNLVFWVGIISQTTFNLALWVSTTRHRNFTYIPKSVITFPKWWVKPLLGEVEGKGWNLSFKQHFKVNIWRFASNCQKWLSKNLIFFQILPIQSL